MAAVLALLLGVGVFADGRLQQGVLARWEVEQDNGVQRVAHTVERSIRYERDRIPAARFVQHWNFERDGVPAQLFPFRATFFAGIQLSESSRFQLESSGESSLWIDGKQVASSNAETSSEDEVPAGSHGLKLEWRADLRAPNTFLRLKLCDNDSGCRFLPPASLAPGTDDEAPAVGVRPTAVSRVGLWLGLTVFGLLLGFLILRFGAAREDRRRLAGAVALGGLVALHLGLRLQDYDAVPDFRENGDELFATWNGWQLLEDGTTAGWSLWAGAYPDGVVSVERLPYFGLRWDIVRPYLEHPPLLHLLAGAAAHLGGAKHFAHSRLVHTRLVPISLSVVVLLLLFLIARRFDPGGFSPWIAGILYATLPLTAIQGRVIKEEALVTPLALGSVWCFLRWRDDSKQRWLYVGALLAGACILAKVPAFAFAIAFVALVLAEGRLRSALSAGVVVLAMGALLFAYGAYVDWDAFVEASRSQGHRPTHPNIFIRWFHHGLINHNTVGRGWAIFLWLATAVELGSLQVRQGRVLVIPLVLYWLAITVGAGNWTFGWYMMPLYPILCIAAGRYLWRLWQQPRLLGGVLFALVLVMYSANFLFPVEYMKGPGNWPTLRVWVSLSVALLAAPWVAVELWPTRFFVRIARGAWLLLLAAQIGFSGYIVLHYGEIAETHKHFDSDVHFDR